MRGIYVISLLLVFFSNVIASSFLIGSGIGDVTGPPAEVGMMGYGNAQQTTGGIHFRQYARAFIVIDMATGSRVVYVNMDVCFVTIMVKKRVLAQLDSIFPGSYNDQNVLMTATHTHAGPGGFSWYTLYDITTVGWKKQTVDAVVKGVVEAIQMANSTLVSGNIFVNKGRLATPQTNINRSPTAYQNNPENERRNYTDDVEKESILIKFVSESGVDLGCINWFAVHGTSMNNTNHLISGDNKGYASYLFEAKVNKGIPGKGTFVAAFTNTNEGDVSPNTKGAFCPDGRRCDADHSTCNGRAQDCKAIGPGRTQFESTQIIGRQQYDMAQSLYNGASIPIRPGVRSVHKFVDMENVMVQPQWTGLRSPIKTCAAAIGDSFAAGTTDGCGEFDFVQGNNNTGNPFWNWLASFLSDPSPAQIQCHYPKPILLNTGHIKTPTPWSPSVLPLQIFNIGQLYIIAVPSEFTTMAGRRLKNSVRELLLEMGAPQDAIVTIAGLANAYSQYTTTKEEYNVQRYEGASTLYGPNQLAAYQQEFADLATHLIKGTKPAPGPEPTDWTSSLIDLQPGVLFDDGPIGTVRTQVHTSYKRGENVLVSFYTGHPNNNIRPTYMTVEFQQGSNWKVVATDSNWETFYQWRRIPSIQLGESEAILQWRIPLDAPIGSYRITHYGDKKQIFTGKISAFTAQSAVFKVIP